MRLMCTMTTAQEPLAFSAYLTSQGIENSCEALSGEEQGNYRIWIYDEDCVGAALAHYDTYLKNPHAPLYNLPLEDLSVGDPLEAQAPPSCRRSLLSPSPYGKGMLLLIFLSISLFIWAQFTRPHTPPPSLEGVLSTPSLSPMEKELIFDYPPYFVLRDTLLTLYTTEDIKEQALPSAQAAAIWKELQKTPVWDGFYERLLLRLDGTPPGESGPLFYAVRRGEIWRLFTPALLHYDFLHILFNLLWLVLLGNQIEHRIGSFRTLVLVLVVGILSNTAQYLMSGPFFLGLSGIVCGMAAFIWARQQIAPWEGYLFSRATRLFLLLFVLGIVAVQLISFALHLIWHIHFSIGIANTAHVIGGIVGYLLGRIGPLATVRHALPLHNPLSEESNSEL